MTGGASQRVRFRVAGHSMYPTLRDGDVVDVDMQAFATTPPVAGELVLVRHPYKRDVRMVKRVLRIEQDGRVFVVGDDPLESEDSHGFGAVRADAVLGRVELVGRVERTESS